MFPLRCLSLFLLLSSTVSDNLTTESLIVDEDGNELQDKLPLIPTSTSSADIEIATNDTTFTVVSDMENDLRDLNRDYERLGRIYVAQYYMLFDDQRKRLSLVSLYQHQDSFLSYNGRKFRGTRKILAKFENLKASVVDRSIISVDAQPLADGGLLMNVVGQYRFENSNKSTLYIQTFIFQPQKGSFFLQHDIFREISHSSSMTQPLTTT